jgi:hypothetical protein
MKRIHVCRRLLSYRYNPSLEVGRDHAPFPSLIAHFNIFCAHKNANEPTLSLQLWQNSGSSLLLVVWQL